MLKQQENQHSLIFPVSLSIKKVLSLIISIQYILVHKVYIYALSGKLLQLHSYTPSFKVDNENKIYTPT